MKWDATAERKVAILALQQHPKLIIDTQKIIDNWPDDEKPTFRAVTDRVRSLRKLKLGSEGDSGIVPATPTARLAKGNKVSTSSSNKRKNSTTGNAIADAQGTNSTAFKRRLATGSSGTPSNKRHKRILRRENSNSNDEEPRSMDTDDESDDHDDFVDAVKDDDDDDDDDGQTSGSSSPSARRSIKSSPSSTSRSKGKYASMATKRDSSHPARIIEDITDDD